MRSKITKIQTPQTRTIDNANQLINNNFYKNKKGLPHKKGPRAIKNKLFTRYFIPKQHQLEVCT